MSEALAYKSQRNVTLPAIGAMAAGFALGLIAKETQSTILLSFADIANPVGAVWTNALRMIVLPLMVSYIILAINSVPQARTAGKLGGLAMIAFISMLGAAALFTLTVGAEIIRVLPIDESARAAFKALGGTGEVPAVPAASSGPSVSEWISQMVPSNPFRAAVDDNFIGVVISTVLFALAIMQIEEAKAICRRCTVVDVCLKWAIESGQDAGVWGGMSEDERRALKRRNARARRAG